MDEAVAPRWSMVGVPWNAGTPGLWNFTTLLRRQIAHLFEQTIGLLNQLFRL